MAVPVPQSVDPYTERRIVLGGLSEHLSTIRRGRRIMFVGCGTSYHAAMACRQVLPNNSHILCNQPCSVCSFFSNCFVLIGVCDGFSILRAVVGAEALQELQDCNNRKLQDCNNRKPLLLRAVSRQLWQLSILSRVAF